MRTEASAALAAVERAAEALEAEVAAIVCGGEVVAAVGYPEAAAPAAELISVAAGGAGGELAVPGVGVSPRPRWRSSTRRGDPRPRAVGIRSP
jgi:hypothetical protein